MDCCLHAWVTLVVFTDKDFIDFKNLQAATLSSQSRTIVGMVPHAWYGTIMLRQGTIQVCAVQNSPMHTRTCTSMHGQIQSGDMCTAITGYYTHSLDTIASTNPALQTLKVAEWAKSYHWPCIQWYKSMVLSALLVTEWFCCIMHVYLITCMYDIRSTTTVLFLKWITPYVFLCCAWSSACVLALGNIIHTYTTCVQTIHWNKQHCTI